MATVRSLLLAALIALPGMSAQAATAAAESLRQAYAALQPRLQSNAFGRPLHIDSREGETMLGGDIYAVVEHPFNAVRDALAQPQGWCDILILQFNTKRCEVQAGKPPELLVNVGRKSNQPLEKTVQVRFPFHIAARDAAYFSVVLAAPSGPYGTKNYRILLEAVPLENGRSFLHLSYSYEFGVTVRLATRAYLATSGRDKVGFTIVGKSANGSPAYVGGVRGMVERNTMRYYLAIESHLDTLAVAPAQRLEKRLAGWFAAIERYPRQLHEMERDEYLSMKRREIGRQG
jgi:hypothetical protein